MINDNYSNIKNKPAANTLCESVNKRIDKKNMLLEEYEHKRELNKKTNVKKKKSLFLYLLANILIILCYLIIGFSFKLWHPGWLILMLIPIVFCIIN